MGRTIEIIVLVVLILITAYYYVKARKEAQENAKQEGISNDEVKIIQTVKIEGMMCQKCASRVIEALSKFGSVDINLEEKTATIAGEELIDTEEIKSIIEELGYTFEGIVE